MTEKKGGKTTVNILHIHDCAGVAATLAKYQRKLGHNADAVMRDGYDSFGIEQFYGVRVVTPKVPKLQRFGFTGRILRYSFRTLTVLMFYLYVGFYSRRFDVVHVHSQFLVTLFLRKPFVVEFHGDDIRRFPSKKWKIDRLITDWFTKYARCKFLVSTPDLLVDLPCAEWLPNPVDTEYFRQSEKGEGVVFFDNWHETARPENTRVVDRNRKEFIPYAELPKFLAGFGVFLDRRGIKSLSKTALEALSVGLTVVDWQGNKVVGLPKEHEPFKVARKSLDIYRSVMRK